MAYKMRVNLLAGVRDISVEGSVRILEQFKNHFSGKHDFHVNPVDDIEDGIINIHSSGFLDAIRYRKLLPKCIYSINSNFRSEGLKVAFDIWQNYVHLHDVRNNPLGFGRLMGKWLLYIVSQLVPLCVKRSFISKARMVVVPNEFTYKMLKLRNSKIIRQGIDTGLFRRRNHNDRHGKVSVSYFGHVTSGKGLIEAIKAMSQLPNDRFSKRVFLSTKSNRAARFIRRFDEDIEVRWKCDDIVKDYSSTDILIAPFRHTAASIANPFVVLEAMACGCAVVTSDLPYLREICGRSARYIRPYHPEDIVEVCKGLTSKDIARMGRIARDRITERYDVKEALKAYENLYKELSIGVKRHERG